MPAALLMSMLQASVLGASSNAALSQVGGGASEVIEAVKTAVGAHTDGAPQFDEAGAEPSAYASLALGLVLFYFLTQIRYIGFLIWLAAIVAGLGGIYLAVRRHDPGVGTAPGAPEPPPAQMVAMS